MRVAHFVQRYPPAPGGSEAYFARLSRHLAAAGDSVSVFTTTAVDLEAFWQPNARRVPAGVSHEDGVEVRRHDPAFRVRGRRYLLKALSLVPVRRWQLLTMPCNPLAPALWREAGRTDMRFDVVHATAFPYGWVLASALRLARRLGVPFVVTPFLHLGDPDDPRDRTRRAYLSPALTSVLAAASRVFVQTDVERDALLRHGVAAEKLVLQGMGVDPAECTGGDRGRARAAWGAGPGECVVGHLANNSVEKGTVDLLRAAELAWRGGCRFRLVLAGPEMANFRAFWEGYEAKDRVIRLGPLDDGQKRDFFAGIDAFAMPSRSDSFGLVFLEAWANGAPSVAYCAGGVPGVIRHDRDGLLVRCGDLYRLAAALRRLTDDDALRTRLGGEGRARLPGEFRWEDKLDLVRRVYRQLA
ncbi:MAG TPA: glycosyltransferase family 4 protein [Gemmataceae bacterium]|nr:glycosyltransferase family 4 protein [Gemmataceae bacterium]